MAHVVTDACIKDFVCVAECATSAIAPMVGDPAAGTVSQVYINPDEALIAAAVPRSANRTRSSQTAIYPPTRPSSPRRTGLIFSNLLGFGFGGGLLGW
jgi:hypothetical protein